jgi:hypothetical protein
MKKTGRTLIYHQKGVRLEIVLAQDAVIHFRAIAEPAGKSAC